MQLNELQQQVDQWIKTIGVKYFHQLTNLGILMEETGELSRLLVRIYGEQSFKSSEQHVNHKEQLADEMADILWVLTAIANQCDINLEEAMLKNMDKKTSRDKERHTQNSKLKN